MKNIDNKYNFLSKVLIIGVICSFLGRMLSLKYSLVMVVLLTIVIIASFTNEVVQKKEAISNKYFYHSYISVIIGSLMFIVYLLGQTILSYGVAVQATLIFFMVSSFIYFIVVGLIMLLNNSDKEIRKIAKFILILFIIATLIIFPIIIYTILNKHNL